MRIYRAVNVYVAAWEWIDFLKEMRRFCSRRGGWCKAIKNIPIAMERIRLNLCILLMFRQDVVCPVR
jgi:hypothetical protein